MITYIKGNLLESDAQALVNTVNTVGIMGKGIALQFKEKYPDNFRNYKKACDDKSFSIGMVLVTPFSDLLGNSRFIINFPTKTTWRKPSEYEYIESGLNALKKEIVSRQISSIAIPPLGTNNGGLEWNRVKTMIITTLSDLDCDIRIYEPSDIIVERMKTEKVKMTPTRAMILDVICDMVSQGEFASEFAAEKIAYFLQKFGASNILKLKYNKAPYGPYSGKIRYILHSLNGSYVMGMGSLNNKPFDDIWITKDASIVSRDFLEKNENKSYLQICERTKSFLSGFYSDFSLELLASVDYILSNMLDDTECTKEDELIRMVQEQIGLWNSRKQRLFDNVDYIKIAVEHIKKF